MSIICLYPEGRNIWFESSTVLLPPVPYVCERQIAVRYAYSFQGFGECLGTPTGDVMSGICETGCPYLIPFVVVNAISALSGTLVIAPLYVIVLR